MKSAYSPKVKKIGPTKMTSPDKFVVTGHTEKNIKTASTKVTSATSGYKKPISPQNVIKKITTSTEKDHRNLMTSKQKNLPKKIVIEQFKLTYEGDISNGKFHGNGTIYDSNHGNINKYIYKGQWRNGSRQGNGHYIYPDQTEYIGEWQNNMKHGKGIFKNANNQKYEGQWRENQRHGNGKLSLSNGAILEGEWEKDEFKEGKVTYPNGSTYEGAMQNYQRQGHGVYSYGRYSDKFEGQFLENAKNGRGKYSYSNGDLYEGNFKKDQKDGKNAKYIWSSGRYELIDAEFKNDRPIHGSLFDRTQSKNVKTF